MNRLNNYFKSLDEITKSIDSLNINLKNDPTDLDERISSASESLIRPSRPECKQAVPAC